MLGGRENAILNLFYIVHNDSHLEQVTYYLTDFNFAPLKVRGREMYLFPSYGRR